MRASAVVASVLALVLAGGCALPATGRRSATAVETAGSGSAPGGGAEETTGVSEAPGAERAGPDTVPGGAVVALVRTASDETRAGRYDAAAGALERAIRIEPGDSELWARLAEVRLRQGQPRQAEATALKAVSLAGSGRRDLKARGYRLVAEARRALDDLDGAREADAAAARWEEGR